MNAPKRLYCEITLSRPGQEEGWCVAREQRLPADTARSTNHSGAYRAAPAAPTLGMRVALFFAIFTLACVFGVIGAIVAGVLTEGAFAHTGGVAGAMLGGLLARSLIAAARSNQA